MAKGLFFLTMSLLLGMSVHSQEILTDINKYKLDEIEKQTIKKSRKLLKIPKKQHLFNLTFFTVGLLDSFYQETGTVDDFLKNLELIVYDHDKYRCFIYDDSLNIVATAIESTILPWESFGYMSFAKNYLEYIKKINPEYVFQYKYYPRCPMFFCYKDGEIIILYLSDNKKDVISLPLSELKDWRWLNSNSKGIK